MSTLVLTAHPDPDSLTHEAARRLSARLDDVVVGHLAQEDFDPRWSPADRVDYADRTMTSPDVLAEQARVDAVDDLVLVFPVYWWSVPALMKGWIDRVLIAPWAFDYDADDRVLPRLQRLTCHLVAVSGTEAGSWERHGYSGSFSTQLEHGVMDFCGMRRGVTAVVHDVESGDDVAVADRLDQAVDAVVGAIGG